MSSPFLDFVHFYQEGGPVMHLILLAALFSGGLGLVALLVRTRTLGLVALGAGLLALSIGVVGWQMSQREVEEVLMLVASDQREQAREVGTAIARIPLKFGAICAAPGLLGGLLGLALARPRG